MKTKLYIYLLLFLISTYTVFPQKENICNASIFLDIDYAGIITMYDEPGGRISKRLKNDIEGENILQFNLLQRNDTMFYVSAYYSMNEDSVIARGWIKKNKHLGIYSRAYDKPLLLYNSSSKKSGIKNKIDNYNPEMYIVIDCLNNWLKVKTIINGKYYEGWIPPEMQCSNVYSTCS